jgi:hypothetical protein
MEVTLDLSRLSIMGGGSKRILEVYTGESSFKQRKHYDEYTVCVDSINVIISLYQLIELSKSFNIIICPHGVLINEL